MGPPLRKREGAENQQPALPGDPPNTFAPEFGPTVDRLRHGHGVALRSRVSICLRRSSSFRISSWLSLLVSLRYATKGETLPPSTFSTKSPTICRRRSGRETVET